MSSIRVLLGKRKSVEKKMLLRKRILISMLKRKIKSGASLTELRKIYALIQRLNFWMTAQLPKYSKHKRCYNKKSEYKNPGKLKDVSDGHELELRKKN